MLITTTLHIERNTQTGPDEFDGPVYEEAVEVVAEVEHYAGALSIGLDPETETKLTDDELNNAKEMLAEKWHELNPAYLEAMQEVGR